MSDNTPEQDRTKALPAQPAQPAEPAGGRTDSTAARPTTAAAPQGSGAYAAAEPELVKGPYLAPVLLGVVCLLVAAAAFAQELADWTIDWGNVGPLGIVAAGALLVVLGALGLLSSRRRRG
jgi:hypothetical protein